VPPPATGRPAARRRRTAAAVLVAFLCVVGCTPAHAAGPRTITLHTADGDRTATVRRAYPGAERRSVPPWVRRTDELMGYPQIGIGTTNHSANNDE